MKSKFLSINETDVLKWFIVACLSALLTALYNILQSGTTIGKAQLVAVALAWITAGLGYIIKNIFTSKEWYLLKPEPVIEDHTV